ncbi:hypothetical protein HLC09_002845, partial [Listeria monocytogenes]|nr:hypothetical protein [Listeria monocytogenes]EFN3421115.1 hypothetical protein [Listeria monocytogenes]
ISCNSPQLHSTEGVPFPQANSMGRILSILEYIKIPMNKNELAKICEFDIRQSDYYSNALIYLGFAKRNEKSEFVHTQLGSKISKMANNNERNKIIIESILKFKIFKKIFDSIIINGGEFDTEYIFKLVLVDGGNRISESTIRRRTSTVCAWMRWIFSVIE